MSIRKELLLEDVMVVLCRFLMLINCFKAMIPLF